MIQDIINTILEFILGTGYTDIHVYFLGFLVLSLLIIFKRK